MQIISKHIISKRNINNINQLNLYNLHNLYNLNNLHNSNNLYTQSIKSFCLYIPQRKLTFINHKKHGRVCPVYIADDKYLNQSNPKRLMPIMATVSGINLYLILIGLKAVPFMKMYSYIVYSEPVLLLSLVVNIFVLRKYLNVLIDHKKRVKNLYLKPNGINLLIESFSGEVFKLECNDIYERRIEWKYQSNANQKLTNNNNSFRATIKWGNDKESIFEGRRRFMDSELMYNILNRNNIDTTQTKYKENSGAMLNFWTDEEKKKVLEYLKKRIFLRKINFNKLHLIYYYYLNRIGLSNKSGCKINKNNKDTKDTKGTKGTQSNLDKKIKLRLNM